MNGESKTNQLLHILISVMGRIAIPESQVRKMVLSRTDASKYVVAYNLCDGTRSQAETARIAKIDKGNFGRAASRWLQDGIVFPLVIEGATRLLHIYALSATSVSRSKEKTI